MNAAFGLLPREHFRERGRVREGAALAATLREDHIPSR